MGNFLIIPQLNNINESLALAEEYGFGFEYNDFFNPDILDDIDALNNIIDRYKRFQLPEITTVHGAFLDVTIFSQDKHIRLVSEKRIHQSIKAAAAIGAKGVVFHTNYTPMINTKSYVNGWIADNTTFWSKTLEEYPNIEIYIENMFDRKPDLIVKLAENLSNFPNFGICYDYAHASVFGDDIDEWTEAVAPYVKHMHINDNDLKDDLHLAVGDGKIDWQKFCNSYNKHFSDCSVLIETSSIERQQRSAEFLRKLALL